MVDLGDVTVVNLVVVGLLLNDDGRVGLFWGLSCFSLVICFLMGRLVTLWLFLSLLVGVLSSVLPEGSGYLQHTWVLRRSQLNLRMRQNFGANFVGLAVVVMTRFS